MTIFPEIPNQKNTSLKMRMLYILSSIVIVGFVIDIIILYNNTLNLWENSISIVLILLSLILTYFKVLAVRQTLIIVVYSLILNIFSSYFLDLSDLQNQNNLIFRSILIVGMLLPIAGFVIDKKHSIIVGLLFFLFFIAIYFNTENNFIIENILFVESILFFYTTGIYYLLHIVDTMEATQEKLMIELEEKNLELNRTNNLLIEQNIYIETRKEEQKNLVESRDKLFSIISHDIKNPLFAIISFCDLTRDRLKSNEYEKVDFYLKMIQLSSTNLYRLIVNLLDWTRLQNGKLKIFPESLDVNSCLDNTIRLFENSVTQKEISLKINRQDEIRIPADKNMFSTIFRNLLSNAIKYTPRGGSVTVDSRLDNGKYFLVVSDNGVGMKSEDIEKLFKNTINQTTAGTDGESGTGLGLHLCKEFINLHNGSISIQSEIGVGSAFIVCLPA